MSIFDDRICALGEGPLWHPERKQLFWFDILGKRLLTRTDDGPTEWAFDEHVSAAGWVDHDTLLIASQTGLSLFDLTSGDSEWVAGIEVDDATTRSNDGRADPFGGFWIGTMGLAAQPRAGAIYRYYRGQVETLFHDITISNAICFAPDGRTAYFTDTPTGQIMRQALDGEGWPDGKAQSFITLARPDGAVVDAEGCLWIAQWGASRVARYSPDGHLLSTTEFPASHITCPAFGGTTLFATSAADGINEDNEDNAGKTFFTEVGVQGQPEHRVIL